jgi:hypothetical protein
MLAAFLAGCGGGSGLNSGATVDVYVAGALCAGGKKELASHGGEAGEIHVRAICLPRTETSQGLDLAQIGANARRATQDSGAIAYIGEPTKAGSRFSETILEAAGVRQYAGTSGAEGMAQLLKALEDGRLRRGS